MVATRRSEKKAVYQVGSKVEILTGDGISIGILLKKLSLGSILDHSPTKDPSHSKHLSKKGKEGVDHWLVRVEGRDEDVPFSEHSFGKTLEETVYDAVLTRTASCPSTFNNNNNHNNTSKTSLLPASVESSESDASTVTAAATIAETTTTTNTMDDSSSTTNVVVADKEKEESPVPKFAATTPVTVPVTHYHDTRNRASRSPASARDNETVATTAPKSRHKRVRSPKPSSSDRSRSPKPADFVAEENISKSSPSSFSSSPCGPAWPKPEPAAVEVEAKKHQPAVHQDKQSKHAPSAPIISKAEPKTITTNAAEKKILPPPPVATAASKKRRVSSGTEINNPNYRPAPANAIAIAENSSATEPAPPRSAVKKKRVATAICKARSHHKRYRNNKNQNNKPLPSTRVNTRSSGQTLFAATQDVETLLKQSRAVRPKKQELPLSLANNTQHHHQQEHQQQKTKDGTIVIKVPMKTGILYLYRGKRRSAKFVPLK